MEFRNVSEARIIHTKISVRTKQNMQIIHTSKSVESMWKHKIVRIKQNVQIMQGSYYRALLHSC